MTRIRTIALLLIIATGAAATLLPAARDEISWCRAASQDQAVDFKKYLETWPNGRHAADARLKYRDRQWVETEKAMIQQAYEEVSHPTPEADADYRKQKRLRRDAFFWKAASSADSLQSYESYLGQFPEGQFVRQARARIDALTDVSKTLLPTNSLPAQ